MTTDIESLAQFNKIQENLEPTTKLILLLFFEPLCEKCSRMEGNFDAWSEDEKFKSCVLFLKCSKENCNHDIFEKYNVKAIPTILFIKDNEQVPPPFTKVNDDLQKAINDVLNSKK